MLTRSKRVVLPLDDAGKKGGLTARQLFLNLCSLCGELLKHLLNLCGSISALCQNGLRYRLWIRSVHQWSHHVFELSKPCHEILVNARPRRSGTGAVQSVEEC